MSDFFNPLLDEDDEEFESTGRRRSGSRPIGKIPPNKTHLEKTTDLNDSKTYGGSLPKKNTTGISKLPIDDFDDSFDSILDNDEGINDDIDSLINDSIGSFVVDDSPTIVKDDNDDTYESSSDFTNDNSTILGDSIDSLIEDNIDEDVDDDIKSMMSDSMDSLSDDVLDTEELEEDILSGFNIDEIIADAIDADASDIYVNSHMRVAFKYLGELIYQDQYIIPSDSIVLRTQQSIVNHVLDQTFVENRELDTSYVVKTGRHKGRRLRLSVGKSFGNIFLCFRVITDDIPTPEQLGITGELASWVNLPKGLIMVNGATGSGKSTSISSLIRQIQINRPQTIITLEKPIEYVYPTNDPKNKALIIQREVGLDCLSFSNGLTSAMRQAPDIIIVGEVRTQEEVNELLRSAETGHLAISTMHTDSSAQTINRIKSLYQGDDQARVLSSLGAVARGFCNQTLVKSVDGKKRTAVREILTVTSEVQDMILKGDVKAIQQYQYENKITMEHELAKAILSGACDIETARAKSADPLLFDRVMREMKVIR